MLMSVLLLLYYLRNYLKGSPLEYIVTLGFSSVTMHSNGDADASAAADARCG